MYYDLATVTKPSLLANVFRRSAQTGARYLYCILRCLYDVITSIILLYTIIYITSYHKHHTNQITYNSHRRNRLFLLRLFRRHARLLWASHLYRRLARNINVYFRISLTSCTNKCVHAQQFLFTEHAHVRKKSDCSFPEPSMHYGVPYSEI